MNRQLLQFESVLAARDKTLQIREDGMLPSRAYEAEYLAQYFGLKDPEGGDLIADDTVLPQG